MAAPSLAGAALLVPKESSGELGYDYRQTRYDNGPSTISNMVTGRLVSAAYLWQPWFVTMGISLALTEDKSSSNSVDSTSHFSTGDFNMTVLPMSRFPFSLRYAVSDSRVDSSAGDNPLLAQSTARQFSRNSLQVSQGYYGDLYRINLRYNNDESQSDKGEHYLQQGYAADYSWRGQKQNLMANALRQIQSNNQNSSESGNTVVTLNHSYYPNGDTTLDTLASHVRADNFYTIAMTGVTQQTTSNIDQASTMLSWRSSRQPLHINGGLRVHQMDYSLDNGTAVTSLQNEGFNSTLGAAYQFSERISGSINGQYNTLRSDASTLHSHNEGAMLNYSSLRHDVAGYDYGWHGSIAGSNLQSGESKAQTVSATLGHGVVRSWQLEARDTIRFSFNQDLSEGNSHSSGPAISTYTGGVNGETRRLAHSLALGWMSNDSSGSSMAQLSASDSRGVIGDESKSQMVNVQLSRSQLLDNRSSLNGNLTWQAWHYDLPGSPDYGIGQTSSAGASYRYARPFTLQRVTFISDLRFTDNQPAVGPSTQDSFWDNRFTHEIGMMRSSLGLTYREHKGVSSMMITLSVKRLF